jgi:hypothetical protein
LFLLLGTALLVYNVLSFLSVSNVSTFPVFWTPYGNFLNKVKFGNDTDPVGSFTIKFECKGVKPYSNTSTHAGRSTTCIAGTPLTIGMTAAAGTIETSWMSTASGLPKSEGKSATAEKSAT